MRRDCKNPAITIASIDCLSLRAPEGCVTISSEKPRLLRFTRNDSGLGIGMVKAGQFCNAIAMLHVDSETQKTLKF